MRGDVVAQGRPSHVLRPGQRHHLDGHVVLFGQAVAIAEELTERFISGEVDRVVVMFNEFVSIAHQSPVTVQLLPIVPEEAEADQRSLEYIFEPDPKRTKFRVTSCLVNFYPIFQSGIGRLVT